MNKVANILFALLLSASVFCVFSADPVKPVWPVEFSIPFGIKDDFGLYNKSAVLYYNYDQAQSQMIDYFTNCFPLVRYDSSFYPCKIFFNPKGIYASLPALNISCCLFVEGVGTIPPDFLHGFTYSGKIEDAPDYYGIIHKTYLWQGDLDFKYWTDVNTTFDVQFQDGFTSVRWNFGKMNVTPQPVSLFDLPAGNCEEKCEFFGLEEYDRKSPNYDPFLRLVGLEKQN